MTETLPLKIVAVLVGGLLLLAGRIADAEQAAHWQAYDLIEAGRHEEGLARLEELAAQDDPGALKLLGYLYLEGIAVDRDLKRGVDLTRRAADLGDLVARTDYGRLLLDGEGVDRDIARGLATIRSAADGGESLAHVTLGELYYYRGDPIPFDLDEAVRWFTSAHRLGDPDSARPLGEIRLFADQLWDRPDLLDCDAGEDLLRAAIVNAGDGLASLGLGWAYYDGLTCEDAPQEAMRFFKLAEGYGAEGAALALGIAYAEDVAAPRDRLAAVRWLALALERGEEDARPWLDWTIAGLDPPLSREALGEAAPLQTLLETGAYALPANTRGDPAPVRR